MCLTLSKLKDPMSQGLLSWVSLLFQVLTQGWEDSKYSKCLWRKFICQKPKLPHKILFLQCSRAFRTPDLPVTSFLIIYSQPKGISLFFEVKVCKLPSMFNSFWPHGSSFRGTLQARILEWVAISFTRGSSWPGDQTQVSYTAGGFFTRDSEPPGKPFKLK